MYMRMEHDLEMPVSYLLLAAELLHDISVAILAQADQTGLSHLV